MPNLSHPLPSHNPRLDCYKERNATLRKMGFSTYADYLASPLWQGIRTKVLARDRHVCRLCGGRASQVHHRRYYACVLKGKNLSRMFAVCGDCHEHIEFDEQGKTSLRGANVRIKTLRPNGRLTPRHRNPSRPPT